MPNQYSKQIYKLFSKFNSPNSFCSKRQLKTRTDRYSFLISKGLTPYKLGNGHKHEELS